jgi:hypothetical protein
MNEKSTEDVTKLYEKISSKIENRHKDCQFLQNVEKKLCISCLTVVS